MQRLGVVFKNDAGVVKIRLNFDKRYITLSSIATVIGLAFVLKDPENILGESKERGITCALVDAKSKGVDKTRRHDPLNVPFVNAPLLGKDVIIVLDDVIGGESGLGNGWRMLMESLYTIAFYKYWWIKTCYLCGIYIRCVVRYQFGLSIAKFESI